MRVPLSWLNEFCDSGMTADQLAERLALTGTEVERVSRFGAPTAEGFVVGYVDSVQQHPDADRLRICAVDIGSSEPATIVCGAPNVAAGQTVAVALPGATMPDGTVLKRAKLRGVESSGMILAQDELQIGTDHAGIMELSSDHTTPGTPLAAVFPPGDDVLELEITPNRPDCLAIYGVAREVHAVTEAKLASLPADVSPAGDESFPISVEDESLCPRFTARLFDNVKVGPSPIWLQQRLAAAGQRPINNVVDITNYVMLLTGQPMHAFDRDRIRGGRLVIRRATDGEMIETLDGIERKLDSQMVVVCDADGPSGIAGIMGGAVSEVDADTTRVLLEVASWHGPNIHRTSRELGLRSEASGRFEKGLSPGMIDDAQSVASRLFVDLCGAELVSATIDVAAQVDAPPPITLGPERVERLLGMSIPVDFCQASLERLGFTVESASDGLKVTVPFFRVPDVTREADLIEEIARVYGVDRLPTTLPAGRHAVGRLSPTQKLRRTLEGAATAAGFNEAITWTFTSHAVLERFYLDAPIPQTPVISNPLSEDHSVMRPLLSPGLLEAVAHNTARGIGNVRLFEIGRAFSGVADSMKTVEERDLLAAVATDFSATKAVVESILSAAGVTAEFVPSQHSFLHPGKQASIAIGAAVGWVGDLHPIVCQRFDIPQSTAFELDLGLLADSISTDPITYQPISEFPSVRFDLAVVVGDDTPYADVLGWIRDSGGPTLAKTELFDVYRGDQIGSGRVSLAVRLEFSALDRTLTDGEVNAARTKIENAIAAAGGDLRGA